MRIGLLQLNPTVGELDGNAARILAAARKAADQGAKLCITPELALTGYPPRDLLLYPAFVAKARQTLEALARDLAGQLPEDAAVLVGGVAPSLGQPGPPLANAAFLLANGKVAETKRKSLLPTYDVFDETRYFSPALPDKLLSVHGRTLAVTICEDLWNDKDYWPHPRYPEDPLAELAATKAGAIINLSASPFSLGKQQVREAMLAQVARKHGCPVVYVNQCGGNDDLVFDGRSVVLDANGNVVRRLKSFAEDVAVVDLDAPGDGRANAKLPVESAPAEAWAALVLGTRDYVRKCGFTKAVLGLSGGVDSALTAAVAAHALGPDNVLGVRMPSPYSSQGSLDDAEELARNLGMECWTLPIQPLMDGYGSVLAGPFAGRTQDVTEENIQSRIRGNLLMAVSNKLGAMLLTTGNKSELAVGYCTIYGDMSGGLAVLSDAPKHLVYELCRYANQRFGPTIPENVLTKPPSAELRPDQTDQDSLPPYETLDEILRLHVEEHLGEAELTAKGFEPATVRQVLGLVCRAEFKRQQAAPGLKITERAFGTGWRMPIACRRPL